MVEVVLCEDNPNIRSNIRRIITEYIKKENVEADIIKEADNAEDVLMLPFDGKFKRVYILDIEVKGNMNGLILAKEIRKRDLNGYIIFITSHVELGMHAFKYKLRALDFISKDENMEYRLKESFDTIKNEVCGKNDSFLNLREGSTIHKIDLKEIYFIETSCISRKIVVHTKKSRIECYMSLKKVQESLDERFYKAHRSCIINTDYLESVSTQKGDMHATLRDGYKCLVSKNYLKGLLEYVR